MNIYQNTRNNSGIFYQYTANTTPAEKGVYECIDFANNRILVAWDGKKFEVLKQDMIHFFKSDKYLENKPSLENWSEMK